MRKLIPIYAILTALTLIVSASCNSSGNGDNEPTVVSANTLVSNFRLQKNDSVMTLLDSIPFTIDVNRRLIYNPDSLPKGTDITRLVASISLASSTSVGEISISGATTMKDTTYTYNASATDSIDFTGRVTLTVKAADGISTKQYLLQVNVHNLESDSLYWNKMSRRNLPGALTDPETAKAVAYGGTTYCLVAENGNYTMSSTTDIATNNWNKQTVAFTFKPDVNSLTATDKALFVLDANGNLHKSTDGGINWTATGNKYSSLIAGYGDTLLAVATSESGYFTVALTDNGTETKTAAPKEFPVKDSHRRLNTTATGERRRCSSWLAARWPTETTPEPLGDTTARTGLRQATDSCRNLQASPLCLTTISNAPNTATTTNIPCCLPSADARQTA